MGYQIGYLANLVPIPGGVGILKGGMLGALLLYKLPAGPTAAAVVIYHAIALWVPALGGTIGFTRLRRTVAAGAAVDFGATVQSGAGNEARATGEPIGAVRSRTAIDAADLAA